MGLPVEVATLFSLLPLGLSLMVDELDGIEGDGNILPFSNTRAILIACRQSTSRACLTEDNRVTAQARFPMPRVFCRLDCARRGVLAGSPLCWLPCPRS